MVRKPASQVGNGGFNSPMGHQFCARIPTGRGTTLRALPVCVRLAPRAPSVHGPAARWTNATVRKLRLEVRFLSGSPFRGRSPTAEASGSEPEQCQFDSDRPYHFEEGAAEWPATGPENQGSLRAKGSIPAP